MTEAVIAVLYTVAVLGLGLRLAWGYVNRLEVKDDPRDVRPLPKMETVRR